MMGIGLGFDTRGAGKITVKDPKSPDGLKFQIPDSREGWVESLELLLDGFFHGKQIPSFDYSQIRQAGAPIKGFGGTASGPDCLEKLHKDLCKLLLKITGERITSVNIVDIMNMIARCVIAGNTRRSASIAFGLPEDKEYVTMKDPKKYSKELMSHRWSSNNSIFAETGKTDYSKLSESIIKNGEPGIVWLENARKFGRLIDGPTWTDKEVLGTNPCQPGWAKILTKDGIREFNDIKIGDVIWSEEGWTEVINKFKTGIKKVYKYITSAGIFYGTENHKILQNNIKTEVKNAHSIDILNGMYKTNYIIDPHDVMDGLVVGDGSIHKASNNLVYLIIGDNDGDYFNSEIKDLIIKYRPGIKEKSYEIKTTINYTELPKTYERRVPERFIKNPNKLVGFLRGLFSANGSVVGNRITLKAASKYITEDIQLMLNSIGIRSFVTTNKSSNVKFSNGEYLCKESYDINITVDRDKFMSLIGFIQEYKNEKIKFVKSRYKKNTYDVQSVEFIAEEEVYDITVNNNSHTYWTQGCNVSNCGEIFLPSTSLCNLVETFPSRHSNYEEYKETLKYAYLYGKTVTLISTHWEETNAVIMKDRRIGISQSGIIDAFVKHGRREVLNWCDNGYKYLRNLDEVYSNWLCVPKSIKISTTKPSGSVSLLPGVSPGIHYPHSEYYIRRIRIASNSPIIECLKKAGYEIENVVYGDEETKKSTLVISFPIHEEHYLKGKADVSMWEQVKNVYDYQYYWSDNSVSCTIHFKKEEEKDIPKILEAYEDSLKALSFLPLNDHGYEQAPYEEITKEKYEEMVKKLKTPDFSGITTKPEGESFCNSDNGICQVKLAI